jgi:tRNA pseudouridine13 synthase
MRYFRNVFVLTQIPRNLRLMYVHAYQSYIWNMAASARIRLSATKVLEGDLIFDDNVHKVDLDDPDEADEFTLSDDILDPDQARSVRALTAEDVSSGRYSIHDIVLPTPGYNVTYPGREDLRHTYVETMSANELDPFNMRRNVRLVSMAGHYRKVVYRPEHVGWDILRYDGRDTLLDTEPLSQGTEFLALRVRLRLGTSQYATMALREACKRDSVDIQYWGKEREEQEKARKADLKEQDKVAEET